MAKIKSSGLRNYVGRLAGSIYYLVKGQNIAREVAAQVTNPKTQPQMQQRVRLANLVNFYRANKEWMKKYAYEVLTGLKTIYNEFVSQNLTNLSAPLSKEDAANGVVVPDFLKVTKGSLPSLGSLDFRGSENWAYSTINVGPDANTIGSLSKALMEYYSSFKQGDQLSAIIIGYFSGKPCLVSAYELIINTENTDSIPHPFYVEENKIAIDPAVFNEEPDLGYAVCLIHSSRMQGKVLVSTEVLSLSPKALAAQRDATSARAYNKAIDSYGYIDEPFLDPAQARTEETFKVTAVPSDAGTIKGAGSYPYGTEVKIQAVANGNYTFTGWKAPYSGKPNPFTLTVTEDTTIEATYTQTE